MATIHPAAEVSPDAEIGTGSRIWRQAHIREGARIGIECNVGAGVYVGAGVRIGDRCKIQNDALLYEGLELESGVFVGPQVCFTNDLFPRAINPDGTVKDAHDWTMGRTIVRHGAAVGAGAVVITGVEIGAFAMIGAGSIVTRDVPAHALVMGSPARLRGWVCACGHRLTLDPGMARGFCEACHLSTELPATAAEGAAI